MIKAVLDTNVYLSALFWEGTPHSVFKRALQGDFSIFISPEIVEELTRKLEEKFEAPKPIVDLVETLVLGNAHLVRPEESLNIVQEDPTDNKILECAQQQGADYIVSGDHHLLDIGKYQDIQIVSPREFLETLKSE